MDPSIIKDFNMKQFKALIFGSKNIFKDNLLSLTKIENKNKMIFNASDFNKYGDLVKHWTMPPQPYKHISHGDFREMNMDVLDYYKNGIEDLRNKGIQVIIIPPSLAETSYNNIEERLIPLFSEFEKRDINFSIPPQESTFADSLFFDTYYHLGYEGVLIRTNQLVKLMKTVLIEDSHIHGDQSGR
jgi:hypothetical protein